MLEAVALARQRKRRTAPNPCVGALLVKDGNVVASGLHEGPGQNHAEVACLEDAAAKGINPAECTMVVTLEPCAHHGKTPPCTTALLRAGIRHLVIGCLDPTPEAGGGADYLASQGITVETGVAESACHDLIADFLTWTTTDLPYLIVKLASTLDGRIATRNGNSKWISSEETRMRVHTLRKDVQAVIIGGNTFYQDDPLLTCRLPDCAASDYPQPLAVILTSRLPEAGASYKLLKLRPEQTMFWTTAAAAAGPKAKELRRAGAQVIGLASTPALPVRGHGMRAELNPAEGLRYLRNELGMHYVLCEGGGRLGLSLLDKGLVGELHIHLAPKILGDNEAAPLFDGRGPSTLDEALQLRILESTLLHEDIILTLRPNNAPDVTGTAAAKTKNDAATVKDAAATAQGHE